MGNPKAFLTINRKEAGYRPVHDRVNDFGEVEQTLNTSDRMKQASRCMDCGVPFCHWACPLGNKQPEWQHLVYMGKWKEAYQVLESTCDFPEFTGRICPAPCEKSCVLKLSADEPVTNREKEVSIAERAFLEGYIKVHHPERNGKKVAVIGSGPAGLTAANRLNRKGYLVTVFEKNEMAGGLLRYGIPNFKLAKNIVERRIDLMREEGVIFKTGTQIDKLPEGFDAYCIAIGAEVPRDLPIEGRNLKGIHFAMDYLSQQNRLLEGIEVASGKLINAKGKKVLVIGGGDTGSDCVGTANRQKASKVTQIEILEKPPVGYTPATPWPTMYPQVLKKFSSHEEGCERRWSLTSCRFIGDKGILKGVEVEEVTWETGEDGRMQMQLTGKKEIIEADLVFLAMGFVHPVQEGLIKSSKLTIDNRKNITIDKSFKSSVSNVFACGDATTGASLVVKAMAAGRDTAKAIDSYLSSITL